MARAAALTTWMVGCSIASAGAESVASPTPSHRSHASAWERPTVPVSSWQTPSSSVSSDAVGRLDDANLPPQFFKVSERAARLAKGPPRPVQTQVLPGAWHDLAYESYRRVRYRTERALWRHTGGSFEAQFFHPGFLYVDPVRISELTPKGVRPISFGTELFTYDGLPAPSDSQLAFSGLRLHAPLNRPQYKDEFLVFQGSSYFRPLGSGTHYGLSARGLAVDFGRDPEEFPRFSEFFLRRPDPGDQDIWVLALLESASLTGAYAFRVEPGDVTVIDVRAQLFPRRSGVAIGLAPLSSMYLFGEEAPRRFAARPEVHDSDGLSLWYESGEWLFRRLRNPKRTTHCSYEAEGLRGFGLVQRDRSSLSYQDPEAKYEARPSVWVEPLLGFERGAVQLLEIATTRDTDDNIAVAWDPGGELSQQLEVRYRLHVGRQVIEPSGGVVSGTRSLPTARGSRFLVDFRGTNLGTNPASVPPVTFVLSAPNATIVEQHIEPSPQQSGHRLSFEVEAPERARDVEMRAFLRRGEDVISETWSYLWQPNL